jgi:ribose/xylose/arabinose/galactoside ABC-type transport system permease subunit
MAETVETRDKPSTAREIARRFFRHENAVLGVILVIIIAALAAMTRGESVTLANVKNVLVQSSMRGLAAVGQLFVILSAGIDLSVSGVALLCAIIGASLLTEGQLSLGAAVPIMLLTGLGIGALNGLSVSRLGMAPLIVTLAMWQMTNGVAYQITQGQTIWGLPEGLAFFGSGVVAGVPVPVIIFVAVAAVAYYVLNYTTFGRSVYAVGGNSVSAWLSGIRVPTMLFSVYVISGFLAAFAGLITVSRTMSAMMVTVTGLEMDSIAAVAIGGVSLFGGRGTLIGVVIGVTILGVINNGMNIYGLGATLQNLVKGAIILAAVTADTLRRR